MRAPAAAQHHGSGTTVYHRTPPRQNPEDQTPERAASVRTHTDRADPSSYLELLLVLVVGVSWCCLTVLHMQNHAQSWRRFWEEMSLLHHLSRRSLVGFKLTPMLLTRFHCDCLQIRLLIIPRNSRESEL